jgi:hypothetical protein
MAKSASARALRGHIASLETMTKFVLATLALASGVYTYLGVRTLLDGSATMVFFAAIIYSAAVSVGIYGFWTYMMRFLPELRDGASRASMLAMMALGSAMIIAMSSWLNAAALAGSAAVEQHLAVTLEGYTSTISIRPTPTPSARCRCCPTSSARRSALPGWRRTSAIPAR